MKQEILDKLFLKDAEWLENVREAALKYRCVSKNICPECGGDLVTKKNFSWFVFQSTTKCCKCGFSETEYRD